MSPAAEHELPVDPDVVHAELLPRDEQAGHFRRQVRRAVVSRRDILMVIAAGGAVGCAIRFGIGELLPHARREFPWSTFAVNVSGCFVLGLLMVWLVRRQPSSRYLRPFLAVGVLGGYTTFSSYALEARDLIAADRAGIAMMYVGGSVLAGLLAVWLGIFAGEGALSEDGSVATPEGQL